jgi:hypothetical protein
MEQPVLPEDPLALAHHQIALLQQQVQQLIGHVQQIALSTSPGLASGQLPSSGNFALKPEKPEAFRGLEQKSLHVETWLFQVKQYYRLINVTDESTRIQFAASLLQGHAARWYRLQSARAPSGSDPFLTWENFEGAIRKQFTPVNYEKRARDRLSELRQTTSVQRYLENFTALCLEITDLHPTEQLHRFVDGLKPHVRREVELRDAHTFEDAASMAERVDNISFSTRGPTASTPQFQRASDPMELGNLDVDLRNQPQAPRLSADQRQRLRESGVCYYCHQPGHLLVDCPIRQKRPASDNAWRPPARPQ